MHLCGYLIKAVLRMVINNGEYSQFVSFLQILEYVEILTWLKSVHIYKLGMFSLTSNRIFFSFIQLGLIIDKVRKPTANVLLLKSIYWICL